LIMLMQFQCRTAGCSTQQDRRRRMLGCRDVVWCEAARGLHEPQSGELLVAAVVMETTQLVLSQF